LDWRDANTEGSKMRIHIALALLLPLSPLAAGAVNAQTGHAARTAISAREQMRQKMNDNLLILMSGPLGAAYIQLGSDIAVVVNDGVEELRKPPRHPAWRNVNVMGTIRGWQRFPAAQEWINRNAKSVAALRATPVIEQAAHAVPSTAAEQERLFQNFLKWAREHKQ
jgi:hypothetical protein